MTLQTEEGRLRALEAAFGGRAVVQAALRDGEIPGPRCLSFPFRFDTPGLATGIPIFTPRIGDVMLAFAIGVTTPWDGLPALGDFGVFAPGGFFAATQSAPAVSNASFEPGGILVLQSPNLVSQILTDDPWLLCVSQDGTLTGGAPVGGTQGEAVLTIVLCRPIVMDS